MWALVSILAEVEASIVAVKLQGVLDALTNVYVIKKTSDGTKVFVKFDENL